MYVIFILSYLKSLIYKDAANIFYARLPSASRGPLVEADSTTVSPFDSEFCVEISKSNLSVC